MRPGTIGMIVWRRGGAGKGIRWWEDGEMGDIDNVAFEVKRFVRSEDTSMEHKRADWIRCSWI